MNSHLLPGAALLGLVSGVANAAPTPIGTFNEVASASNAAPAGSTGLGPGGAVGGIGGPIDFTAPFAGTLIMTVQQPTTEFAAGDVYQAFVDGHSLGFTAGVPLFGTQFSSGTFTTPVPQGLHNFDINDQIFSYLGFPSSLREHPAAAEQYSPGELFAEWRNRHPGRGIAFGGTGAGLAGVVWRLVRRARDVLAPTQARLIDFAAGPGEQRDPAPLITRLDQLPASASSNGRSVSSGGRQRPIELR